MSAETLAIVLNHSKAKGTAKLVLIGIANHDGDGGAWPSIATLARYANVDERNVRKAIAMLQSLGELKRFERGGGTAATPEHLRPNLFHVTLDCPPWCDRSRQHRDTRRVTRYVPRYLDVPLDPDPGAFASPPDGFVPTPPDGFVPTPGTSAPPELNQELPIGNGARTSATTDRAREEICNGGCGRQLRPGQARSHGSCMDCVTMPGWWKDSA